MLAETLEAALIGAALLEVSYEAEEHNTDFGASLSKAYVPQEAQRHPMPSDRSDASEAYAKAPMKIAVDYHMPPHHHNPMEMHATTGVWQPGGAITVYDKTQGSQNVQAYLAGVFGLAKDKVTVRNAFVGGGFGSGLRPPYQVYLATMAARHLECSVRVSMTRQQMVSHVHRPRHSSRSP